EQATLRGAEADEARGPKERLLSSLAEGGAGRPGVRRGGEAVEGGRPARQPSRRAGGGPGAERDQPPQPVAAESDGVPGGQRPELRRGRRGVDRRQVRREDADRAGEGPERGVLP